MKIEKTTLDRVSKYREEYLNSLPEFQELFIELMISDSDFYILHADNIDIGYAIRNSDGALIEFYLSDKYITGGNEIFRQLIKELSITDIYCKSFDSLLLSNCLLSSYTYSLLGVLYRDYVGSSIKRDPDIKIKKAGLSSVGLLRSQDDSIQELFETEQQLVGFIQKEHVFEFYLKDDLVGCGMVIRTHPDWEFCDLGVWVSPSKRGRSIGSQILLYLREFAITNNMKPSCGCAIENLASQKTIEKSGFVSRYKLINFRAQ